MTTIVMIQDMMPEAYALLDNRPDVNWRLIDDLPPEQLAQEIADADAITVRISKLTESILDSAPKLRVISRHGVGYDNVPIEYCTKRGIAVAITGDANSTSVAEHAIYMMLSAARAGCEFDAELRRGNYGIRNGFVGKELNGKSLLVIGYGRIGRRVAELAQAFGMQVLVHDPYAVNSGSGDPDFIDSLEDGLRGADILSIHVPLTSETRGLIGAAQLDMLPPGAIVVNVSRGGLVDEDALIERLRNGHLFAAGLDTFVQEPLPPDSPFFQVPRVVLSPHSASLTDNSLRNMAIQTVKNALDGLDGRLSPQAGGQPGGSALNRGCTCIPRNQYH